MRFVIGGCFDKRVTRFVKRGEVKNRYNKIEVKNKVRFFPKGVMRFVIGGCFDKRGYEIRQKRRCKKIGTIK